MLDFEECATSADCARVDQCVSGICEPPEYIEVTNFVSEDTTWTADRVYVLKNVIFVTAPATLTIEPGTLILGERDSALVTERGARLVAEGTRADPIVFSSAKPVGQRRTGDWGGLALIGRAPINRPDMNLNISTGEADAVIGGDDETWDCGTLKYVRSEFGGGQIDGEKALNGLTLAGCGSETTVDYVQAHLGDDDGIELFGGTVDIRHAVSTRPQGDAFDFDVGWRGTAQFLAIQMDVNGEEAIEVENRGEEPTATPQTDFQVYNYTVIGAEEPPAEQRGVIFKSGGLATLSHGIIHSVGPTKVLVKGAESAQHGEQDRLIIEHTLFTGMAGMQTFALDDMVTSSFDPSAHFTQEGAMNVFGIDAGFDAPFALDAPGWIPSPESATDADVPRPPDGFDTTAVYRGAFSPTSPAWTEGWTAYPKN